MIVTLSETVRGLDGWFTTAKPEGGEPIVLLVRHRKVDGQEAAREAALRMVQEFWPDAQCRAEGGVV